MKRWQRKIGIILVIIMLFTAILNYCPKTKNCCLCSSFRYHAPCLIDLNTGDLVELGLYAPHETKVAELTQAQPESSTFSFISLGDASGIKLTGNKRIEIDIPNGTLQNPALCRECRKKLPVGYKKRYIFADLYDEKILIPVEADKVISLRCYQITTARNPETNEITAAVQGTL